LYSVTDLYGDYAGTVQYEFASLGGDGWRMERMTDTQGDSELLSVELAANGFRPSASTLVRSDGDGEERVSATYEMGEVNLELTTRQNVTTYERINVPSDSRDARSLFMLIRSLPLGTGYSTRINTFLPVASQMSRTAVTVLGQDEVETPAGTFTVWSVELDEGDRTSRAWIATEAPHQLVKYEEAINGGVFELAEYQPGQ
jgi:hypothetical protein